MQVCLSRTGWPTSTFGRPGLQNEAGDGPPNAHIRISAACAVQPQCHLLLLCKVKLPVQTATAVMASAPSAYVQSQSPCHTNFSSLPHTRELSHTMCVQAWDNHLQQARVDMQSSKAR